MNQELHPNGDERKEMAEYRRGTNIANGIVIGAGFGIAMGTVLRNLGLGIAVGTSFGIAIGAALDQRRMREAGRIALSPDRRTVVAIALGGLALLAAGTILLIIFSAFTR